MDTADLFGLRGYYRRLPEELRHNLRPLNGVDALASFLPSLMREPLVRTTDAVRRLAQLRRVRWAVRLVEGTTDAGIALACVLIGDERSVRWWRETFFAGASRERIVGHVGALGAARATDAYDEG